MFSGSILRDLIGSVQEKKEDRQKWHQLFNINIEYQKKKA